MTRGLTGAPPRPLDQRRRDVLAALANDRNGWLSTASADGVPHLVPLAFVWDGEKIVMSTREDSRTARNLRANGRGRLAVGSPTDVVLVDGDVTISAPDADVPAVAAELPLHPSRVPGCVYLFLTPKRVQAWRDRGEMREKVVMAAGHWLDQAAGL
ncbi:pyridoxamine 5'-phosphate oxidase family protein [Fodinicola acaciae]|uniref:pyridoxamine 5'-phosphate oxidase family protein n=1 Tax=Fodinicola acaciae TaxID=2681555 RepID=UPI0013D48F8F|nr:pyridoxamine 5'-phosphate oxidase family protein [Fodinicola acaciae]